MIDLKNKSYAELHTLLTNLENELVSLEEKRQTSQDEESFNSFADDKTIIPYITASKQVDEELTQERILIENIIKHSLLSTWITDETGTIIFANPIGADFFGISPEKLIGSYNVFSDDRFSKPEILTTLQEAFIKGNSGELELQYDLEMYDHMKRKKILEKTVHLLVIPIVSDQDKVTNILWQVIDLSEMNRNDKVIRRHQDLLEMVINTPEEMVVLAVDTQYRYLFFNKHHNEWSIRANQKEAQVGKCIFDIFTNKEWIRQVKPNYDIGLTGKTHQYYVEGNDKQGVFICYEIRLNPIYKAKKEIMGITIMGYNVTKRRTAEIALANTQNELIEQAHKAGMADIAVDIIHDIGNVLNSIFTSTCMLKDQLKQSPVNKIKIANRILANNMALYTDFILKNPKALKLFQYFLIIGRRLEYEKNYMAQIVQRLLEKVRIIKNIITTQQQLTADGLIIAKQDIAELVNDGILSMEHELNQQDISIEKRFAPLSSVSIHKTKLMLVIKNVLKNAQEAMLNTPPSKRKIAIIIEQTENEILCKVSDKGMGIKPENLEKIFSHGFTTKKDGNGFGLHSCANLMTEMKGKIYAESAGENKGATFIIKIPL